MAMEVLNSVIIIKWMLMLLLFFIINIGLVVTSSTTSDKKYYDIDEDITSQPTLKPLMRHHQHYLNNNYNDESDEKSNNSRDYSERVKEALHALKPDYSYIRMRHHHSGLASNYRLTTTTTTTTTASPFFDDGHRLRHSNRNFGHQNYWEHRDDHQTTNMFNTRKIPNRYNQHYQSKVRGIYGALNYHNNNNNQRHRHQHQHQHQHQSYGNNNLLYRSKNFTSISHRQNDFQNFNRQRNGGVQPRTTRGNVYDIFKIPQKDRPKVVQPTKEEYIDDTDDIDLSDYSENYNFNYNKRDNINDDTDDDYIKIDTKPNSMMVKSFTSRRHNNYNHRNTNSNNNNNHNYRNNNQQRDQGYNNDQERQDDNSSNSEEDENKRQMFTLSNRNADRDSSDNIDPSSLSYVPGTLTEHKLLTLGTPQKVQRSFNRQQLENKQMEDLATRHLEFISREGDCKWPKPRMIKVRKFPNKLYPSCIILHRCANDTGCCSEATEHCSVKNKEDVELHFFSVNLMGVQKPVKLSFENHTECKCTKIEQKIKPETPIINQMPLCRCPQYFHSITRDDGTCHCDCVPNTGSAQHCYALKNGTMTFLNTERESIINKLYTQPTCQYGNYHKADGVCPREAD